MTRRLWIVLTIAGASACSTAFAQESPSPAAKKQQDAEQARAAEDAQARPEAAEDRLQKAEEIERRVETLAEEFSQRVEKLADQHARKLEAWATDYGRQWEDWAQQYARQFEDWATEHEKEMETLSRDAAQRWEQWGKDFTELLQEHQPSAEAIEELVEDNLKMLQDLPLREMIEDAVGDPQWMKQFDPEAMRGINELQELMQQNLKKQLERAERLLQEEQSAPDQSLDSGEFQRLKESLEKLQADLDYKREKLKGLDEMRAKWKRELPERLKRLTEAQQAEQLKKARAEIVAELKKKAPGDDKAEQPEADERGGDQAEQRGTNDQVDDRAEQPDIDEQGDDKAERRDMDEQGDEGRAGHSREKGNQVELRKGGERAPRALQHLVDQLLRSAEQIEAKEATIQQLRRELDQLRRELESLK